MSNTPSKAGKQGKMQVFVPANLEPTYANLALISNSPSEIVLDFAQVMPRARRVKVKARTVMTPMNAKLLLKALNEHLRRFEEHYGEITIPKGHSLADELFRSAGEEPEDRQDGEDS